MNGIRLAPSPCGEGWDEANKKSIPIHLSSVASLVQPQRSNLPVELVYSWHRAQDPEIAAVAAGLSSGSFLAKMNGNVIAKPNFGIKHKSR